VDIGLLLCAVNAGAVKLTAAIAAPKISLAIFAMIFVLASGQRRLDYIAANSITHS
jgi:hypothetical protein